MTKNNKLEESYDEMILEARAYDSKANSLEEKLDKMGRTRGRLYTARRKSSREDKDYINKRVASLESLMSETYEDLVDARMWADRTRADAEAGYRKYFEAHTLDEDSELEGFNFLGCITAFLFVFVPGIFLILYLS